MGAAAGAPGFEGQRLHILNWSDYLDAELVSGFERAYGVELLQTHFETDEDRDRLLAETGVAGYDLVILDSASLLPYRKRGWIRPFDSVLLPSLGRLLERCVAASGASSAYSVPYFWGTLGIAYRADLVESPLRRWMDLYRPEEGLRGKIVMIDDAREVLGMAARALGYSVSSEDLEAWEAAGKLAREQRPFVHSYGALALDETSSIVSAEVAAAQVYNGDAVALRETDSRIRYVHPEDGSTIWVDHWALFADAPHPELAHAFLDYIGQPDHAAQNAQSVYFATCSASAERLLPEAFLQDPVIYPPREVMARLEPYRQLGARALRRINLEYARIKARE
ncbi:polyamine ABC transporter substrate-binding protein [Thiorhodococcus minor]|uniref:Spermidine/putrescine ABC transporter substrate-binding protein n=1 Tax=Thiorhodococcus minor TaxID=57489 RepID=A0A6M0K5E8_9GAMM|nr:spermidine/putrescine ABC transporter substrate-binding protein [Thiorhodococcus minor]NEV63807.1 spermidine/putrescine ABC transporter substrate-binding protein [Thiorhodococcus minor]